MNLTNSNFSRSELTKEFQEFGGEKHRRHVARYSYESKKDIFDIEIFAPVPCSFGFVSKLYRRNGISSQTPTHAIHRKIEEYFNL